MLVCSSGRLEVLELSEEEVDAKDNSSRCCFFVFIVLFWSPPPPVTVINSLDEEQELDALES